MCPVCPRWFSSRTANILSVDVGIFGALHASSYHFRHFITFICICGCFGSLPNRRYSFNDNAFLFVLRFHPSACSCCLYHLWHLSGSGVSQVHLCVGGWDGTSQLNYGNECKLCTKWIKNVYRLTQFAIIHSNAVCSREKRITYINVCFFCARENCVFIHLNFDALHIHYTYKWLTLNKHSTPLFTHSTSFLVHAVSFFPVCLFLFLHLFLFSVFAYFSIWTCYEWWLKWMNKSAKRKTIHFSQSIFAKWSFFVRRRRAKIVCGNIFSRRWFAPVSFFMALNVENGEYKNNQTICRVNHKIY